MKTRFKQADGSMVELEAPGYSFIDPWDSMVRLTFPLDGRSPDIVRTRQLHISHAGNHDYTIETELEAEIYHRLSAQGGEILVAASRHAEAQGMALWRGPYHEVSTYVPDSTHRDVSRAMRPLLGLTFLDSPDGLEIIPDPSMSAELSMMDSTTCVEGIGEVDVFGSAEALGSVPSWSGSKVAAGEIWRIENQEEGDDEVERLIQLATETALLVINPFPAADERAALSSAVGFAESITRASVGAGRKQS